MGAEVVRCLGLDFSGKNGCSPRLLRGTLGIRSGARLRVVNAGGRRGRPTLFSVRRSAPQGRRAGRETAEVKNF